MKIIVYVEGPSDGGALKRLLFRTIENARVQGVGLEFLPLGSKKNVIFKAAGRAINILQNSYSDDVFALPDLYPPNVGQPHTTSDELKGILIEQFHRRWVECHVDAVSLLPRFHTHCLKHDLEALVLAAEEGLKGHLRLRHTFPVRWVRPVENQNMSDPPKRVIERLFRAQGRHYVDTIDAPAVLARADVDTIAQRCPQCFGPFHRDLVSVASSAGSNQRKTKESLI